MRHASVLLSTIMTLSFLVGCDEASDLPATEPAEGVVLLDGTPVEGATVMFDPTAGDMFASGITDASGHFVMSISDGRKAGAPAGEYNVRVTKRLVESPSEGVTNVKDLVPQKYSIPSKSDLKATIGPGGKKDLKFELSSK